MKENEVSGTLGILWVRAMFSVPSNVLLPDLTEFMQHSLFPCHMIKNWSGVGSFGRFVSFIFINWKNLECQSLVEQTSVCHEESGIKEFKRDYILESRGLCMSYSSLILLYNLNY